MNRDEFTAAVAAFQATNDARAWEEHGITWEEAEDGLCAALAVIGIDTAALHAEIVAEREAEERAERKAWEARERARRAKMTPEQRDLEDSIQKSLEMTRLSLIDRIADNFFKSSPFFDALRGGTGLSPNTAFYAEDDKA